MSNIVLSNVVVGNVLVGNVVVERGDEGVGVGEAGGGEGGATDVDDGWVHRYYLATNGHKRFLTLLADWLILLLGLKDTL